MDVSQVDPNSIVSLASTSTFVVFSILTSSLAIIFRDSLYLSVLRECFIFFQSIIFYLQFDEYLKQYHDAFIRFFKYFFLLNGEWNDILFVTIRNQPELSTKFWSMHSFFLPKICIFILFAIGWELSFGWLSYFFCFTFREKSPKFRSIFNYFRYFHFSIFYICLLFPIVTLIVQPLILPQEHTLPILNFIFFILAAFSFIYLTTKLLIFWFDIFIHWIHKNYYQEYKEKTEFLSRNFSVAFTREYYQIRNQSKLFSELELNWKKQSPVIEKNDRNVPSKRKSIRKSTRIWPCVVEPFMVVLGILRIIFFRPSIALKLVVERHENMRNFAMKKLPKQNLHASFGVAVRSYREGDDCLFVIDNIIFRIGIWAVINTATTYLTNVANGEKYRIIVLASYQLYYLIYYTVHLPQKQWSQIFSTMFYNLLTLAVLLCICILTCFPNISSPGIIYWIIYGLFCCAFVNLVGFWCCHGLWSVLRWIVVTTFHKNEINMSGTTSGKEPVFSPPKLHKHRFSATSKYSGVISNLDIVEVLEATGEDIIFDSPTETFSSKFNSNIHAGLAEAREMHSYHSNSLSQIVTPQHNFMIQHELTDSELTEGLHSVHSDEDDVSAEYPRYRTNGDVLLTPRDEDLKPASFDFGNSKN